MRSLIKFVDDAFQLAHSCLSRIYVALWMGLCSFCIVTGILLALKLVGCNLSKFHF